MLEAIEVQEEKVEEERIKKKRSKVKVEMRVDLKKRDVGRGVGGDIDKDEPA